MELVFTIINTVFIIAIGLIVKFYLPSYMKEKGKNLATKEDIAEITRKTEEVTQEFRKDYEQFRLDLSQEFKKEYERFRSDLSFKYDFYYKQYCELYAKLYSIVCQSEYLRKFFYLADKEHKWTFDEIPFIEIHKKEMSQKYIQTENGTSNNITESEKTDAVTKYNKEFLCNFIIENGEYANQILLKLAVAYRFVHQNYSGTTQTGNQQITKIADSEEILLISEIVKTIVKDYNFIKKELKMEYDKLELETGKYKLLKYK